MFSRWLAAVRRPRHPVALANAGRNPADVHLRRGQVALKPGVVGGYEVDALNVVLGGFTLGEIGVADHGLLVQGGEAVACASFDGELRPATYVETGFGPVKIDAEQQALSLALTYEAEFEFDDPPPVADWFVPGSRVRLTGELAAAGNQPWIER